MKYKTCASKKCLCCDEQFYRKPELSDRQWGKQRYCSFRCSVKHFYPIRQNILWSKPEYKKKLSIAHLGQKAWNKGKKVPQTSGDKNTNWKGGITKLNHSIRCMIEYKNWVRKVFARDNWTCRFCHKRSMKGGTLKLESHHVVPFTIVLRKNNIKHFTEAEKCFELWDLNNGITLCHNCHNLTKKGIKT